MSNYKQCRINFNSDDPSEMAAYEHFKSLGRKATEYVINLILADLSGESKNLSVPQVNISNDIIERFNKIETRLSVLEESKVSANESAEIDISSKAEDNSALQAVPDSEPIQEVPEDEENEDVIPMIPADVAARLGGF